MSPFGSERTIVSNRGGDPALSEKRRRPRGSAPRRQPKHTRSGRHHRHRCPHIGPWVFTAEHIARGRSGADPGEQIGRGHPPVQSSAGMFVSIKSPHGDMLTPTTRSAPMTVRRPSINAKMTQPLLPSRLSPLLRDKRSLRLAEAPAKR
jgi:hypothetical protein